MEVGAVSYSGFMQQTTKGDTVSIGSLAGVGIALHCRDRAVCPYKEYDQFMPCFDASHGLYVVFRVRTGFVPGIVIVPFA